MRFREEVTIREESESDELGEGGFGAEDDPRNGTGRRGGDSFPDKLNDITTHGHDAGRKQSPRRPD